MGTEAEQLDLELARVAYDKRRRGERPTRQEAAALRRVEAAKEAEDRWRHYLAIPKKDYSALSGRQAKTLNEQAARYGLPLQAARGQPLNLQAILTAFHDLLAKHGHKILAETAEDKDLNRLRRAKAEEAEMRLALAKGDMLPRSEVRAAFQQLLFVFRQAAEAIARQHPQAAEILFEALEDAEQQEGAK